MTKRYDLCILILRSYKHQKPISYKNLVFRAVCQLHCQIDWLLSTSFLPQEFATVLALAAPFESFCGRPTRCQKKKDLKFFVFGIAKPDYKRRVLQKNAGLNTRCFTCGCSFTLSEDYCEESINLLQPNEMIMICLPPGGGGNSLNFCTGV